MFDLILRKVIETGFTLTIFFLFLAIVLPKEDPWYVIKNAFKEIYKKRNFYKFIFGAIAFYFTVNILETKFDILFTFHLSKKDYTYVMYFIEGNIVGKIQNLFKNKFITIFLTYIYIFTFPIQFFTAIIIFIHKKLYKVLISTTVALGLNYLFVVPFYIFFPVNEVWYYNSKNVEFLALYAYPYFSMEYRNMSSIDNCFPSFHTSMAVTMVILAYYSKIKSLYYLTLIFSILTIISTIYLGFHWVTDVAAGVLVGWIASYIGIKYGEKKIKKINIS